MLGPQHLHRGSQLPVIAAPENLKLLASKNTYAHIDIHYTVVVIAPIEHLCSFIIIYKNVLAEDKMQCWSNILTEQHLMLTYTLVYN